MWLQGSVLLDWPTPARRRSLSEEVDVRKAPQGGFDCAISCHLSAPRLPSSGDALAGCVHARVCTAATARNALRCHTIRTSLTILLYSCPRCALCFRQLPEHSCCTRGTNNAPYPQIESQKLGGSQRHDFGTSTHAHKEMPYEWGQYEPSMFALSSPDRTLVPSCAFGSQQLSQRLRPFFLEKGGRYVPCTLNMYPISHE